MINERDKILAAIELGEKAVEEGRVVSHAEARNQVLDHINAVAMRKKEY